VSEGKSEGAAAGGTQEPRLDAQSKAQLVQAREVVGQFLKGLKSISIYRHNSSRFPEFMERPLAQFTTYLKEFGELDLQVEPRDFTMHGESVLPMESDESLPYRFYRDGIRHLVFRTGLPGHELLAFAMIAATRSVPGDPPEDMLGVLWQAGFQYVRYVIIRGFSISGVSDEELRAEVERLIKALSQQMTFNLDEYFEFDPEQVAVLAQRPDRVRRGSDSSNQASSDLAKQLQAEVAEETGPKLWPKLTTLFFLAVERAPPSVGPETAAIEELGARLTLALLGEENFAEANHVLERLKSQEQASGNPWIAQLRDSILRRLSTPVELERILALLRGGKAKQPEDLGSYLTGLPPAVAEALLEGLNQIENPENRQLLCDALAVLGRDNPKMFIERLNDAHANLADLFRVLDRMQITDRLKLSEELLQSPNPAVRRRVIEALKGVKGDAHRGLLQKALLDPDPGVRGVAIWVLVESDPVKAFAELQRMVTAPDFARRSLEERQVLSGALGATHSPRTIPIFTAMLNHKAGLFNKRKVVEDKLVAVAGLSEYPSLPAYNLLQAEAKKENDAEVLTAVRRELVHMRKKLFGDAAGA
jgi:HEAT repeats